MTLNRRPVCIGCQATCSADEGYRTTGGWVTVCDACLTERRAAWMRTKQARIEAVERVEGLR
jgi:hypothetical protein